jgi:hypothetical protein
MSDETDGDAASKMKPSLALLMFVALRKYLNPDPPKPARSFDEKADTNRACRATGPRSDTPE